MFYDFLVQHWRLIISACLFIASLILALVRRRPITDILSVLYEYCVDAVKKVESSNIVGSEKKLLYAVKLVNEYLKLLFPKFYIGSYDNIIKDFIEDILSTPQKK